MNVPRELSSRQADQSLSQWDVRSQSDCLHIQLDSASIFWRSQHILSVVQILLKYVEDYKVQRLPIPFLMYNIFLFKIVLST